MSAQFVVDEEALRVIRELRATFNAKTEADVIRKALALANHVAPHATWEAPHLVLRILDKAGEEVRLLLNA